MFLFASCSDSLDSETTKPPTATLTNEDGLFEVKIGKTIRIEPLVEGAVNPYFVWKMDGKIVGQDSYLEFSSKSVGQYPFTFELYADNGDVVKPGRIDVLELTPPRVTLPTIDGYIQAYAGQDLEIIPEVMHNEEASYQWLLQGEEVSTEATYVFNQENLGDYSITLVVTNEDGEARAEAIVKVSPVPTLSIQFQEGELSVSAGRKVILALVVTYSSEETTYEWEVGGVMQEATSSVLEFTTEQLGETWVKVTGTDGDIVSSDSLLLLRQILSVR